MRSARVAAILGFFLVVFVAGAGAASATDWRQYGFNAAHTSFNSADTTISGNNILDLHLAFRAVSAAIPSQPIIVNGVAFFTAGTKLIAIDATTGTRLWGKNPCGQSTDCFPNDAFQGIPAFAAGDVWVGTKTGDIEGFRASDGALAFQVHLGGTVLSPSTAGGMIYVTDTLGDVAAIDARAKAVAWEDPGGTVLPPGEFGSTPAVRTGVLYIETSSQTPGDTLFALAAATGAKIPGFGPSGCVSYGPTPAVVGGSTVYLGCFGGLYAFDASTGALRWENGSNRDDGICCALGAPALANGLVFVSSADPNGGTWEVSAKTGEFDPPAVRTSRIVNQVSCDIEGSDGVAVANGIPYTIDSDGFLDIEFGSACYQEPADGQFNFDQTPTVVNGFVYVAAEFPCNGTVCAALEGWMV